MPMPGRGWPNRQGEILPIVSTLTEETNDSSPGLSSAALSRRHRVREVIEEVLQIVGDVDFDDDEEEGDQV